MYSFFFVIGTKGGACDGFFCFWIFSWEQPYKKGSIETTRKYRKGAIETKEQKELVKKFCKFAEEELI